MRIFGFNEKNFSDWCGLPVVDYTNDASMEFNKVYFEKNTNSYRVKINQAEVKKIGAFANNVYQNDVVKVSSCIKVVSSNNCKIEHYIQQNFWDTESLTREYSADYLQDYDYEPLEFVDSLTRFGCNSVFAGLKMSPINAGTYEIFIIIKDITVTILENTGRSNTEKFGERPAFDNLNLNKKIAGNLADVKYSGLYKTTDLTIGDRPVQFSILQNIPYTDSIMFRQYFTPTNSIYQTNCVLDFGDKFKPLGTFSASSGTITSNLNKWADGTMVRNLSNGSLNVIDSGVEYKYNQLMIGTTSERPLADRYVGQQFFDTSIKKLLIWAGENWVDTAGIYVPSIYNVKELDTPYYATKMQQEGVYEDFVSYMDSKLDYDNAQRELETQRQQAFEESGMENYEEWLATQPMALSMELEPVPSEKLMEFKIKYLG